MNGARWKQLPNSYPSKATCHRRFQRWTEGGSLRQVWKRLLLKIDEKGQLGFSETFVDGTFASAKKRGEQVGPASRGKGAKIMILVDRQGTPLAIDTASDSRNEEILIAPLLE